MTTFLDHTDSESTPTDFQFGDRRINRRANFMIATMVKNCEKSLPQTFSSEADLKGAYRFFSNPLVTPEKILKPHSVETVQRCKLQSVVLVIQDSSDVDYTYLDCLEGFGSLHPHVEKGYRIHPILTATEEGTPLGILSTFNYTRADKNPPKKHRNSLSIEEKRAIVGFKGTGRLADLLKKLLV